MEPESKVATDFIECLGSRKGQCRPRDNVYAVVVHTTGSGPITRWRNEQADPQKRQQTPFLTAVQRVYRMIMTASPHYVIGQRGECIQVCAEERAAMHVGSAGSASYEDPSWISGMHEWWAERWPELSSPRELAGGALWRGGSCNANTIGIEVVPPEDDPRAAWSAEAWATLKHLVEDIAGRHQVPFERNYIITHSDAHPVSRTTEASGLPWDPGPKQWPGWPSSWTLRVPSVA